MRESGSLRASLLTTLGLVALNLVAFNVLLGGSSTLRLDLTRDGIYSISPATKRVLDTLDEELTIYGYFSERTHPKLAPLVPEIEDMLDEYAALSRGKVRVEMIDPGGDESAEEEANDRFGVRSTPFRLASKYEAGIVNAYFALVVKYGDRYERYGFDDLIEIRPTPDGDIDVRLRNLEYDLTRAIKKVSSEFRSAGDLFAQIDEPVELVAVMSPSLIPEILADVPEAVREAAAQLEERAGARFTYEEIDPSKDPSVQQQLVERYGTRPFTMGLFSDQEFWLHGYLRIGDQLEQLTLASEDVSAAAVREAVEASVRRRAPGLTKTVGVVAPEASLPPEVLRQLQMQGRMPPQPPPEFEEIQRLLEREYAVKSVALDGGEPVPADVDVLLVIRPKNLDEAAVYQLDQYLMRGGRVVVCVDHFEADLGNAGLSVTPVETGLDEWLAHFGVAVEETLVLDDRNQPLPLPQERSTPFGVIRSWVLEPYPYLVEVRDDGIVSREVAAGLDAVGLYWASPVTAELPEDADLELRELLRSSEVSWTSDDLDAVSRVDYVIPEDTQRHTLALALSGRFDSYFAGRTPPAAEASEDEESAAAAPASVPLDRSPRTRLVVVGNAAFLSDFVARALSQIDGGYFAENLSWTRNLIDWMNLDNDLLTIRARGGAPPRIERLEADQQVAIEIVNYVAPIAILAIVAGYRAWRRRRGAEASSARGRSLQEV
jgi:ABC-2 type transport system permease protein